jgi:hypothetical protein
MVCRPMIQWCAGASARGTSVRCSARGSSGIWGPADALGVLAALLALLRPNRHRARSRYSAVASGRSDVSTKQPLGGARRSSYLDRWHRAGGSNKGGRLSGRDTARQGQRRPIAGLRGKYPAWCQAHVIDQIRGLGYSTLSPRRTGPDRGKDICGRCLRKSRPASDEVRMFVVALQSGWIIADDLPRRSPNPFGLSEVTAELDDRLRPR